MRGAQERMNSRERVMEALNFEKPDRLPKDLGGMRSTCISAFAYPRLRSALGLPLRPPRVYDSGQMLALPDLDVLDALGCDVVTVEADVTNAYEQPGLWHPCDFGGRLPSQVRNPQEFRVEPDGTVVAGGSRMPPAAHTFDAEHAGQILVLEGELPKPDPRQLKQWLDSNPLKDADVIRIREHCRRVRESTDRAVFFWGTVGLDISIHGFDGVAVFPMLCLLEPDLVHEVHSVMLEAALRNLRALLPEVRDYVDIIGIGADDWGNQNALMAPPHVFRDLFLPYRKRHNAECHRLAPKVKTFLHSCGAIFEILDMIIESGTDIINPVQWPAGGRTVQEWKDKCRRRIAMWGGGVNSQATLPLGSVKEVEEEVARNVQVLSKDSGYVFCSIHNILAEIPPGKVIAMYRAAARV